MVVPLHPRSFAFVGLGNMGSLMAANLAAYAESHSLPRVQVWNRTRSKIKLSPTENHIEISDSLSHLAQNCDVIHTCLANDEVAQSVYTELIAHKGASAVFVDHSTLFPTTTQEIADRAKDAGALFVACPVFGPPAAAKSAALLIAVAGPFMAKAIAVQYLVPTLGKGTIDCGEDVTKSCLLKILGNNCILGTIELLSETFTLAEKIGMDASTFYEFIRKYYSLSQPFQGSG